MGRREGFSLFLTDREHGSIWAYRGCALTSYASNGNPGRIFDFQIFSKQQYNSVAQARFV
jgi:hypothetical protein